MSMKNGWRKSSGKCIRLHQNLEPEQRFNFLQDNDPKLAAKTAIKCFR